MTGEALLLTPGHPSVKGVVRDKPVSPAAGAKNGKMAIGQKSDHF